MLNHFPILQKTKTYCVFRTIALMCGLTAVMAAVAAVSDDPTALDQTLGIKTDTRTILVDKQDSQNEQNRAAGQLFLTKIQPLLKSKCFDCHGSDNDRKAGLNLTSRKAMLEGGDSGRPVLVPASPEESRLFVSITRRDEDLQMPPQGMHRLSDEEIDLIRQWIASGAPWPSKEAAATTAKPQKSDDPGRSPTAADTGDASSADWTDRAYQRDDLWSYQPIHRYSVPNQGVETGKIANPVDAFIQQKLATSDFGPAPEADKRTLIRRLTFDLTGLPPTAEEIDAFLNDHSTKAYEQVVDRLLQGKHYGEQMARHWLDIVRYADTSGFSNDFERPNAWRYRDYVIRSFNDDKPYDQFVMEQIAGDELDEDNPDCLIATGFLRMGPWEHTAMSVAAVTRQQYLNDVTHSVGVTFLGQGLRCASCHDHKFDPIPMKDYYRIQAVFSPVQFVDRVVAYQPYEHIPDSGEQKRRTARLFKEAKQQEAAMKKNKIPSLASRLYGHASQYGIGPSGEQVGANSGLTDLEESLKKVYGKRRSYFEREMKRYLSLAYSVYSGPDVGYQSTRAIFTMPPLDERRGKVASTHILLGGAIESPGEEVTPGVLSAVAGSNDALQPSAWNTIPSSTHGRRLAFARWIASPNNTLTARVIANRVWQMHFGTGLVATSNNFGKMGARPTHPELLDWLATWLVDHRWSIKGLNRMIATSSTYRQSSAHPQLKELQEADPNNEWLAYFPVRRLTAEELRDSMLSVSGELNPEQGGPGVFPEINWEVALQPRHIMGSVAPAYQPSRRRNQRHRRTIYTFQYRTLANPMLEVFNKPNSDVSCERRDETNVTPQVFALFNSQSAQDRSIAMALRLIDYSSDPTTRIAYAFSLVYSRAPTDQEIHSCLTHLDEMKVYHDNYTPQRTELRLTVEREMVEELTGQTFTFIEKLDRMERYEHDTKPWEVNPETRAWADLCLVLLNSNEFVFVR